MNLKLSVILGFILAVLTDIADSAATNCTDNPQSPTCLCVSANNSMTFAKGDNTTLCAHFVTVNNTSGNISAWRAAYPVVVDTFSSLLLTGGQLNFQNYGLVEIVIQVYGTVLSVPLTYLQLTEFYSSAFSIIIQLSNGVVQSAYWDHQCATCSSSDCYQFSLPNGTVIDSICNSPSCISTNDSSSCDPQIYVAWIGTDSNGNQLTSAGMRLSRFDQFSLSDIVSANTISPYVYPTPSNTTNNTNTSDSSGNKTDTNTTTSGNTTNTTDSSGNKTDTNTTTSGNTTNTTDSSGNKTDTNTTTTNTTDTSGNKTDTNTTTTNTTDTSGNKTDTNTTTTNTTDTKTTTETSTSTSSSDSSGSSGTTTGSSISTGTDTSTKGDTTTTTGTSTSSGSSTTDTDPSTSTGTDTSTKGDTTTVTKL